MSYNVFVGTLNLALITDDLMCAVHEIDKHAMAQCYSRECCQNSKVDDFATFKKVEVAYMPKILRFRKSIPKNLLK